MRRREFLMSSVTALAAGTVLASAGGGSPGEAAPDPLRTRTIPKTGEALPAIGLGTWQTFDVGDSARERADVAEVLRRFFALGGRILDSSPMYGRSEAVVGALWPATGGASPFLATKVWTSGEADGKRQMRRSMKRMAAPVMDLMQVHNLLDVKTHLPVLREWKAAGTIRYIGVTHYLTSAFDDLERLLKTEALDFVQLPYSVATRTAEKRLLPAARDTGTAVLVNRPFEGGALFRRLKGRPLPSWAAELEADSWAQLMLKFILAHPAVTAPIPATADPKHLTDNMGAGRGPLPDEALRKKLLSALGV